MKRMFLLILTLCMVSLVAVGQVAVTSVNAGGFVQITFERGKWKLMTFNFDALNGNQAISNVIDEAQLPIGTMAFFWDGTQQKYGTTVPTIQAGPPPRGWKPGTNIINRGDTVWIFVPSNAANPTYRIKVSGEVPDETNAPNLVHPGFSFISNPFPADVPFTNLTLKQIALVGDMVFVWRNNSWSNETYQAGPPPAGWKPGTVIGTVEIGEGLLYRSFASTNKTWNEIKPYTWP